MAIECYQLKIEQIMRGMNMQNVLHYLVDNNDAATTYTLALELVTRWDAVVKTSWLGLIPNVGGLRWIEARRVVPVGSDSVWKEYPASVAVGSLGTTVGPTAIAPIIKLYGALDSGIQGRVFLPPPAENKIVNNLFDSGYIAAVNTMIGNNLSFSGAHDWNWAILSRKTNTGVTVSTAALSNIIGQIGGRRRPN